MVNLKFKNKKKGVAYLELVSDMMMFGLIFIILFIALIIAGMYNDKISNDLVSLEISKMDVDYNAINFLRQTKDGKSFSEHIREYCYSGDDLKKLESDFEEYFLKIMPEKHKYRILIEKDNCDGHKFDKTIQKGEIKREFISGPSEGKSFFNPLNYGLFRSPCSKPYSTQIIIPNYDGKVIMINFYDFGCDSSK